MRNSNEISAELAARMAEFDACQDAAQRLQSEAREFEGMRQLPGLDQPRIPLNFGTVGDTDENE